LFRCPACGRLLPRYKYVRLHRLSNFKCTPHRYYPDKRTHIIVRRCDGCPIDIVETSDGTYLDAYTDAALVPEVVAAVTKVEQVAPRHM
jgi:hypothetical protein